MFGMKADRFTGRKILVAGALSAFGPPLIYGLSRSGAEVLATDRPSASLGTMRAWLDGAVQVHATGESDPAVWVHSNHINLAGLIMADPRDGAANAALARRVLPVLARNPDPFLAALCLDDVPFAPAQLSGVGLTRGHLVAAPNPADAAPLAVRFLDAVRAGRAEVRLGAPRFPILARVRPLTSRTC